MIGSWKPGAWRIDSNVAINSNEIYRVISTFSSRLWGSMKLQMVVSELGPRIGQPLRQVYRVSHGIDDYEEHKDVSLNVSCSPHQLRQ